MDKSRWGSRLTLERRLPLVDDLLAARMRSRAIGE
jgi:hypothetical protein